MSKPPPSPQNFTLSFSTTPLPIEFEPVDENRGAKGFLKRSSMDIYTIENKKSPLQQFVSKGEVDILKFLKTGTNLVLFPHTTSKKNQVF
jgi:hypothetical protein